MSLTRPLVLGLAVAACGPSAEQLRERELCYERADAAAQARVDSECSDGFSACSTADSIMEQLRLAQEACP